ncbi:ribosome hibernation-promoting factor, HPF/YfiA family [Candidatus Epulonipiscium viviparus]|uniref:ribosome hibernation-promoting factor, HPF/YfiA family n=1 Tax=Candidatus Epulonipiscium viviparus TaxID=420336 RepID=UPI0027381519|nr:ribosome-associated translation inhibitor RaiA [Candidatus Epulopiscium viviparus]
MKYDVVARNTEMTKGMEDAIQNSISRLEKYFNDEAVIQVTITVEKQRQTVEMAINFDGQVLRAELEGENMYKILDDVVAILERQVLRFRNKLRTKHRQAEQHIFTPAFMDEVNNDEEELFIIKKKKFAMKPMNAEEAIMQMELVGHNFYVYLDQDTEDVNVVYKRRNSSYGLIEPRF